MIKRKMIILNLIYILLAVTAGSCGIIFDQNDLIAWGIGAFIIAGGNLCVLVGDGER